MCVLKRGFHRLTKPIQGIIEDPIGFMIDSLNRWRTIHPKRGAHPQSSVLHTEVEWFWINHR